MKLCSMALLLFLLTALPVLSVLGQQCDINQSELKRALKEVLGNLDVQVGGNISCSKTCDSIERKIDMLEAELDEKLDDRLDELLDDIRDEVDYLHAQLDRLHLDGRTPSHSAASCADIHRDSPSGYYWIETSPGRSRRQYCDMTRSCGGVTGGWMRVAYLDMTNSSHQCPSGLRQRTDSNKRTCVRGSDSAGCSSVTLSTATSGYSRVCGKITAYQVASTDAFGHYRVPSPITIDTYYVDGVSLTHGNPRHHLWTFAVANGEFSPHSRSNCPCINANEASRAGRPPTFVGNDYFCDTGGGTNPLWDGAGCGPLNTCCTFNNPPWFYKQLPWPTTDDIEMRVCRDEAVANEDVAIEVVEIYVQ